MNIQSGYYEAGIALFWLLFAYLFMDKFLFKGQLGEICFRKGTPPHGKSSAGRCRMVRSGERGTEKRAQALEKGKRKRKTFW